MDTSIPYSLIAAVDRNMALGKNGSMAWSIPGELLHFKFTTLGGVIIMGRKTYRSLGYKPLPGRLNIVVSSTRYDPPTSQCAWVSSPQEALEYAREHCPRNQIWVVGGAHLYSSMLEGAQRVVLSRVPVTVEGADAFFPSLSPSKWLLKSSLQHPNFVVESYVPQA